MATQANEYFVITDGTTTCTFSDGATPAGNTDYRLIDGWTPAVAHLSDSQLGGRGPYEDVTEKPDIVVKGATWTAAKANVAALERLMQQAVRWARGENVSVVLVKWAPKGSTVATTAAPFQSVILGGEFAFSAKWHQDQATFQTNGKLMFQRRGAWIINTAVTATSSAVANPGPYPITGMANANNLSPASVSFTNLAANTTINFSDSLPIVLMAQQGSDLVFVEAESVVIGGAGGTAVSDSTNNARGGSIARYTPANTSENAFCNLDFSALTSTARRIAFFAAVRNNSATTNFQVRVQGQALVDTAGSAYQAFNYTPLVTIDTTHTRPRFIPLGILSTPVPLGRAYILATASASSGASSGALDIDYLVALAVDNPYARAIQLAMAGGGTSYQVYTTLYDTIIDPQPLTGLTPVAYMGKQATSDKEYMGYYGDTYPVAASTTFTAAILCKREGQTAKWGYAGSTASLNGSLTLSVSRYNAYVAPE